MGRTQRLGVASVDRAIAAFPGAWLEPEFRGETPPPPGSEQVDFTAFYVVHLPTGAHREPIVAGLRAAADVADAWPIPITPVTAIPNDSLWASAFCFYNPSRRDIHAPEAWELTTGDTSQVVALIDTGVIPYHPDLGGTEPGGHGNFWVNWAEQGGVPNHDDDGNGFEDDVQGWDFVDLANGEPITPGEDWRDEDNDPNDFVGHGTGVASLIGALSDNQIGVVGTAWRVRIMPLRAGWSRSDALSGVIDMSYVAKAIRYATRMGASIINISFSTQASNDLDAAVGEALRSGVVIVLAAGNNGSQDVLGPFHRDIVVVAATDTADVVPVWSNRAPHVDLVAPGALMPTTVLHRSGTDSLGLRQPGYIKDNNGTSYSAPVVSGAVALVQSRRHEMALPRLSVRQMGTLLRFTTDDISAQNPGISGYGAGRLNLEHAVLAGSRLRFTRVGKHTPTSSAVSFSTNRGEERLAMATTQGRLLFLDPARLDTLGSAPLGGAPRGGLAAADLGNGRGTGLFVTLGGSMGGFGGAGAPLPGWPVTVAIGVLIGTPALGDLDGDGSLEIVCAGTGNRLWAWRASGSLVPSFPRVLGKDVLAPLALADLDGAPGVEIVAAKLDGVVHAFRSDGSELAGWPVSTGDPNPAGPVMARVDGMPLVVVASPGGVRAIRPDGSIAFTALREPADASSPPALGDLDQDGEDDVVIATRSGFWAYDLAGTLLPGWPVIRSAAAVGDPIVGYLTTSSGAPQVVAMSDTTFLGLTSRGLAVRSFRTWPVAWATPTLLDAGNGEAKIVGGAGSDSLLYAYAYASTPSSAVSPWPTTRGNYARTGTRAYAPPIGEADVIPPATVADLRAQTPSQSAALLTWTSPSDPGPLGRPWEYEVRYATSESALHGPDAQIRVKVASRAAGEPDTLSIEPLSDAFKVFALRSRDASGNWSAFSNVAIRNVPGPPPPGPPPTISDAWIGLHPPRGKASAVHDPVRDRMVVQIEALEGSGYELWALSLSDMHWSHLATHRDLPFRSGPAVFDPIRDRVIAFHRDGVFAWPMAAPANEVHLGSLEGPLTGQSVVYDPNHDRLVLFGGEVSGVLQRETLEIPLAGGFIVRPLDTAGPFSPPAVSNAAAVYDPVQKRMVMVGGKLSCCTEQYETWALSLLQNPSWVKLGTTGITPPYLSGHAATYDPGGDRLIVTKGYQSYSLSLRNMPTWNGLTPVGPLPSSIQAPATIHDPLRRRMISFANEIVSLSWSGTMRWERLFPPPRRGPQTALTIDARRGRAILFEGSTREVWELPLSRRPFWTQLEAPHPGSFPLDSPGAQYDHARDRLIVVGTRITGPLQTDVWTLTRSGSSTWTNVLSSDVVPSYGHAVYDSTRNRIVHFGGSDLDVTNEVWELPVNESPAWENLQPLGTAPSPRGEVACAYDPVRERLIVFGGSESGVPLAETWTVSLSEAPEWTQRALVAPFPVSRRWPAMAYDPRMDRMLVYGGLDVDGFSLGDLWSLSLDGNERWTQLRPSGPASPGPSASGSTTRALVDPTSGYLLLYDVMTHGLWAWKPPDRPDSVTGSVDVEADGVPLSAGEPAAATPRILVRLRGIGALDTASCRITLDGQPWPITMADGGSLEAIELRPELAPGPHRLEARLHAASLATITGTTDISFHVGSEPPQVFSFRAGPSPSRGAIQFGFTLAAPADYTIDLFDLQGRKVARLAEARGVAGPNAVSWSSDDGGQSLDSGIFFYVFTVRSEGEAIVRRGRIVLLR